MPDANRPGNLATRILWLVVLSMLTGAIVNALRPDGGLPWTEDWAHHVESRARREGIELVNAEQVRRILEAGTHVIFDARPAPEYFARALPGAISVPYHEIEYAFLDARIFLTPQQPVLTYCSDPTCDDALLLAFFLRDHGYTNVVLFPGGMSEWRAAGYPVEGVKVNGEP